MQVETKKREEEVGLSRPVERSVGRPRTRRSFDPCFLRSSSSLPKSDGDLVGLLPVLSVHPVGKPKKRQFERKRGEKGGKERRHEPGSNDHQNGQSDGPERPPGSRSNRSRSWVAHLSDGGVNSVLSKQVKENKDVRREDEGGRSE